MKKLDDNFSKREISRIFEDSHVFMQKIVPFFGDRWDTFDAIETYKDPRISCYGLY